MTQQLEQTNIKACMDATRRIAKPTLTPQEYDDATTAAMIVTMLIRAARIAERLLQSMAEAGFGDSNQADELREALAVISDT